MFGSCRRQHMRSRSVIIKRHYSCNIPVLGRVKVYSYYTQHKNINDYIETALAGLVYFYSAHYKMRMHPRRL